MASSLELNLQSGCWGVVQKMVISFTIDDTAPHSWTRACSGDVRFGYTEVVSVLTFVDPRLFASPPSSFPVRPRSPSFYTSLVFPTIPPFYIFTQPRAETCSLPWFLSCNSRFNRAWLPMGLFATLLSLLCTLNASILFSFYFLL